MDVALAASIFFVLFYPHTLNNFSTDAWISTHFVDLEARFGIVTIHFEGGNPVIGHHVDAFFAFVLKKMKIYLANNQRLALHNAK